jgi:hypothetical protein
MKVNTIPVKVKGRTRKKLPPDVFKYTLKKLNSLRFNDLVYILGVDSSCKLLDYFSGGYIYIPSKKTIKRDFINALIRQEAKYLKEDGKSIRSIAQFLSHKYNKHPETIFMLLGVKNTDSMEKDKFQKKNQINAIRDETLLFLLENNLEKLRLHSLI